ncbi:unnamed protein product [Effrenium voratum]|nr:unnamed protein product [Effrenium voratum]
MSGWEGVGALSGELFSRNVVQNTFGRGLSNLSALSQSLGSFLESCVPQEPKALQDHTWKLGYSTGLKLYWEEFQEQEQAEERYKDLWWSKVLFDPDGHVVRCSTATLDPKGVGVASLIISARLRYAEGASSCPVTAMEQGEAPFIPPERLPGLPQALQLLWDKVASRSSISWFCASSLCYFDVAVHPGVQNSVALTIDDVPCRLGPKNSMLPEVQRLLKQYDAKATFMLMGKFIPGNEQDLISLLQAGHELGNHGLVDKSYASASREEFEAAVDECSSGIKSLQRSAGFPEAVRWFRAPHAKLSGVMSEVLKKKALTNVMCDTYACCPVIQDGDFIGSFLAKQAEHGSIIVIHMPEKGFREWCLLGLRQLLQQLQERQMKAVTVGKLAQLADWTFESHL